VEIFPAKNCGAVEPDLIVVKLGVAGVFFCGAKFFPTARRSPCGQKSHAPASSSTTNPIQNDERERMF
jgi:hypothetical protein